MTLEEEQLSEKNILINALALEGWLENICGGYDPLYTDYTPVEIMNYLIEWIKKDETK